MAMIFYLFKVLQKNGVNIDVPSGFNMKNPRQHEFQQIIDDFVSKKKISMIEFKRRIKQHYIDAKDSNAEACVDDCFKYIFSHVGINLSDEIMYPYRSAFIKNVITMHNLMIEAGMLSLFAEVESYSESSFLQYFLSNTMYNLMLNVGEKHIRDSLNAIPDEMKRLMQSLCSIIFKAKAEKAPKNL